jgi:hypothetical protein
MGIREFIAFNKRRRTGAAEFYDRCDEYLKLLAFKSSHLLLAMFRLCPLLPIHMVNTLPLPWN